MSVDDMLDLPGFGRLSALDVADALADGEPPHPADDVLWVLAAPEELLPPTETQELFQHVLSCRQCYRTLVGYRKEQLDPESQDMPDPNEAAQRVRDTIEAGRVRLLYHLEGEVLKAVLVLGLVGRVLRMRRNTEGKTQIELREGDATNLWLGECQLSLRVVGLATERGSFTLAIEVLSLPPTTELSSLQLKLLANGNVLRTVSYQRDTGFHTGELSSGNFSLQLLDGGSGKFLGSIELLPAPEPS
jgi:hypothetical protein